jgi:hypothetical protein
LRDPEELEQRSTRAWLRIDLLIAISALLISALTAATSLYQTHVIADQLSSSVWPYLGFTTNRTGNSELSVAVENDGLGPAIIRTVELTVDDKPVRDLGAFLHIAKGSANLTKVEGEFGSLSPGEVVRPGDSRRLMDVKNITLVPLIVKVLPHSRLQVCYCSLLEQCWTIRSDAPTDYPEKTGRCARPGPNELQLGDLSTS